MSSTSGKTGAKGDHSTYGLHRFTDIHGNTSFVHVVIPGFTRNPGFFWIPAFAGMKRRDVTYDALYIKGRET
jgi:hypothetical protein